MASHEARCLSKRSRILNVTKLCVCVSLVDAFPLAKLSAKHEQMATTLRHTLQPLLLGRWDAEHVAGPLETTLGESPANLSFFFCALPRSYLKVKTCQDKYWSFNHGSLWHQPLRLCSDAESTIQFALGACWGLRAERSVSTAMARYLRKWVSKWSRISGSILLGNLTQRPQWPQTWDIKGSPVVPYILRGLLLLSLVFHQ